MKQLRRLRRTLIPMAALTVVLAASGCSLLSADDTELVDIADTTGSFHFKVPADWQYTINPGVIAVYASDTLPEEGETIETLALSVLSSTTSTIAAEAEELQSVIDRRSVAREWKTYESSEPEDVEVGGRPSTRIVVAGTDGGGVDFDSAFYIVRTAGRAVGIMAVTPGGELESYEEDLARITGENWFWLVAEDSSAEETETP